MAFHNDYILLSNIVKRIYLKKINEYKNNLLAIKPSNKNKENKSQQPSKSKKDNKVPTISSKNEAESDAYFWLTILVDYLIECSNKYYKPYNSKKVISILKKDRKQIEEIFNNLNELYPQLNKTAQSIVYLFLYEYGYIAHPMLYLLITDYLTNFTENNKIE